MTSPSNPFALKLGAIVDTLGRYTRLTMLAAACGLASTQTNAQITSEQVISGDNGGWSVAWAQANNGRLYHLGDLYGIYRSDDRGQSWTQPLRGFQSDEEWIGYGVAVVPTNANKVYYYGGERVCRSLDGGETWPIYTTISREGLERRRGAVQLAIKPGTEDEIWAIGRVNATDKVTLIRSTNGGSSFAPVGGSTFNSDNRLAHSIHFRPTNPNHVWVGTSNGVYASTDGGSNWTLVAGTSGRNISAIGLSKVPGNNIAIIATPNWVRAINATDWNNVSTYFISFATDDNPGKGSNGHLLALRNGNFLLSDNTRNLFLIGPTGNLITLLSSTRNNTSPAQTPAWADMPTEIAKGDNWMREDIWQDVSQDNTIYSDGGAGPSISTDLGQTWTFICKGVRGVVTNKPVLIEGNTSLALFPCNDKGVLVHNGGGNSDTLATVAKKDINYGNLYVMHQVMPVGNGQTIYGVGGKQGDFSVAPVMIKSTNSGANWTQLPAAGLPSTSAMRPGNLIAAGTVDLNNPNDILVLMGADTGTIHRSTDGGQTFGPALGGIRSFSSAQENFKSAFLERDGVNANKRYCIIRDDFGDATPDDFGFYTSDDKGANWTSRSRPFGAVEGFSVDPKTEGRIWQGTNFNLHTSIDGGVNWIQVDNFQGVSSIDAFNGRVLVYARRNNAPTWDLWFSPDNGTNWQQLTNATWRFPSTRNPDRVTRWKFALDPNNPNRFWCGGLSGAVYTFNATGSSPTPPAITTNPSNTTVTTGSSASFSVGASGNPAPTFQWQRAANGSSTFNNLSNGGSYSGVTSSSLTVSNTTTTMSGDRFRAVATNSQGTATSSAATLTVNSAPVPVITSSLTRSGNVGTALSYTITASNSPTSYNASSLPNGLSVNTATGVISGTPTTAGTFNTTISATNGSGPGSSTLVFTIAAALPPAPVINSALTQSGQVATSLSYTITATNSPTSYNATNLPAGLSVNTSTGVISGTPTAAGTVNTSVSATNSGGTGSSTLVFTIAPDPAAPAKLTGTIIGTTGSWENSGNTRDKAFDGDTNSFFDGPSGNGNWVGLDLGTAQVINQVRYFPRNGLGERMNGGIFQGSSSADFSSGVVNLHTITTNAPNSFTAVAITNGSSFRYVRYLSPNGSNGNVAELEFYRPGNGGGGGPSAPVITSSLTATATQNSSFSYSIVATNSPTSYNATSLPAGLSVNTSTGVISGTPTGTGTSNISISATNGGGTDTETLVLNVNAAAGITLANALDNSNLTWSVGGTAGWTGQTAVTFDGVDAAKSATIDHNQESWFETTVTGPGTLTFRWRISSEAAYDFLRFTINGGEQASAEAISGEVNWTLKTVFVPSGSQTLRWRYVKDGADIAGADAAWVDQVTYATSSATPPSITSSLTATATQNSSFSYSIVATNSPTSYNATSLPAGLSVNTSTGVISGTPTAAGTSNVSISATNGGGTDTESLALTVNAASGGSGVNRATGGSATSNNTDSPNNEAVAQVFDSNVNTKWLTFSNAGWIRYAFGSGASWTITSYAVTSANDAPERDPRNWTLQGSNNGNDWTTVDTRSNETFSARLQRRVFTVASPGTFSSYRLNVSANQSGSILQLAELELYSGSGSTVTAPAITSALTATATQNSSFSYTITASNSPTSYNATSLPAGLSVNTSTGVISGTPTSSGTSNVGISATNSGGSGSATVVLTVNAASGGGSPVKLTGTTIGTTGSWTNGGNTRDRAVDGSTSTFFDGPSANGIWVGLDLGTANQIVQVRYFPRQDWAGRMVGGVFQGSNTADFSSGVTTLHTISATPSMSFTTVTITNGTAFRYVRYLSPNDGYGNVAEVEFYR
ncbi:MAG: hypothetical protein EAZ42_06495 [Verrucomicrobia bacterium]|nr:MAG: hypothetical protein EAZ42_06495 [Verrucomicrobiota bacterium]